MLSSKQPLNGMSWGVLAIEALLVMFSVFLGLWLHAWYESRSHQALADRALEGAFHEAVENCHEVLGVQDYYRAVSNEEKAPEGLRLGRLRNEAWELLVASEAVLHLDYDVAQTVNAIHGEQQFHEDMRNAYMEGLLSVVLDEQEAGEWEQHPQGERWIISDLYLSHRRLINHYARLIRLVGEQHAHLELSAGDCLNAADTPPDP